MPPILEFFSDGTRLRLPLEEAEEKIKFTSIRTVGRHGVSGMERITLRLSPRMNRTCENGATVGFCPSFQTSPL